MRFIFLFDIIFFRDIRLPFMRMPEEAFMPDPVSLLMPLIPELPGEPIDPPLI